MRRHDFNEPFPPLDFERTRVREYAYYSEHERADVVYAFLVDGMTTREMDVRILSLDHASKGYQSFGFFPDGGIMKSSHICTDSVQIPVSVSFSTTC